MKQPTSRQPVSRIKWCHYVITGHGITGLGCARFPEFVQNFSERQILWSLCSVVFHTLTLQLPIQTLHSVAPELQVFVSSLENCPNFCKTSTPQGCARFTVFFQKYFEFQILWSLSSVDFFLSQSNSQFQLDFNLRFVLVLDTLPSQWCRNIFLKIDF